MRGAKDQTETLQSGPPGIVRLTEGLGSTRSVAALFCRADSVYKRLPGVDAWDIDRDARRWPGGTPAVAHPPCRAWGRLRHFAKPRDDEKALALWAVDQVRRNGGVLEHPKASTLWPTVGLPMPGQARDAWGGWTLGISQHWWGHRAEKLTMLYIVGCAPRDLPDMPMVLGEATHVIATDKRPGRGVGGQRLRKGMPGWRPEVSKPEREHTPPALASWLVEVARRCQVRPNVANNRRP